MKFTFCRIGQFHESQDETKGLVLSLKEKKIDETI